MTNKQLRFKNEKIAGKSDIDAVRIAYPNIKTESALSTMAHKLVRKGEIKQAIDEHRAKLAEEVGYTVAQALKEYEEARTHAQQLNQPSAEVSAVTGKARLFGFDKDAGSGTTDPIKPLTPEQEAVIDAQVSALKRHEALKIVKEGA